MTKNNLILYSKYIFILLFSFMSLVSCIEDDVADPDPAIIGGYQGTLTVYSEDETPRIETFENETLEIFRIESESALLDFTRSDANGIIVNDYEGDIVNEESIVVFEVEVGNGDPHFGQASLSNGNLIVFIKNSDTGLKVIEYNGTKN